MKPNRVPSSLSPAAAPAGAAPAGGLAPPGGTEPPSTSSPLRLILFVFVTPLVGVLLLEHFDVPRLLSNWIQRLLG